jgi:hypothetical protein
LASDVVVSTSGVAAGASAPPNDADCWLAIGAEGVKLKPDGPALEGAAVDATERWGDVVTGRFTRDAADWVAEGVGWAETGAEGAAADRVAGCEATGCVVSARLVTVPSIEKSLSWAGPTASSLEGAGKAIVGGAGLVSAA